MQKDIAPRSLAALAKVVSPRSLAALAVVAASFFLFVIVARHGADAFVNVRAARSAGFAAGLSAWLVQNLGAGIWALLVLPMAWGAIIYFRERTPDLLLRFAGTVVLAVSMSSLVGLKDPGSVWAGHVGRATAGALGGLSAHLGGFGTALAWLIVLALFAASGLFATDWLFHTLRRGAEPADEPAVAIATEPPAALLDDPADAEPRGFVVDTPRAAEFAAAPALASEPEDLPEADDDYEIHTSLDVSTPEGWDETVEDGRTVIAAPTGYRGVEFLPVSDELATPEVLTRTLPQVEAHALHHDPAPAPFHDDEFVTTRDAAFFVEHVDPSETEPVPEEPAAAGAAEDEDEVTEAVQALFEAVTAPSELAAAPASGIGLPADSPFLDEFFPSDAGWPFAPEPAAAPSDGASAASEMASAYAAAAPASAAEPAPREPAPQPEAEPEPAFADDVVSIDDVLVSRLPADVFDDTLSPASETPFSAEPAPAVPEPRAEPAFSSEPSFAAEPGRAEAASVAVEEPAVSTIAPAFEPEPVASVDLEQPEFEVAAFEPQAAAQVAEMVVEPVPDVAAESPASPVAEAPAESHVEPVAETAAETVAEVAAAPAAEVRSAAPQLDLFAAALPAVAAAAPAGAAAEPDLSRIHAMELDPLFRDAVAAVLERGRASAVVLQRQLGIGYARGIRILDQMTAVGLVGPDTPTGSRQLRISKEKWDAFAAS